MIQTEQEYRDTQNANKNAALLAAVAPAAKAQVAALSAKAAQFEAEASNFSDQKLRAIRAVQNYLTLKRNRLAEIDKLCGLLGIFEARKANQTQLLSYYLQSEADVYARTNADVLKGHIILVDIIGPILPGEVDARRAECSQLDRGIASLCTTHGIDLPALEECLRRGPQPVEPEISFEQK